MPTESKYPDAIYSSANYTAPSVLVIDDDPDSPDGLWLTWDTDGDTLLAVDFPTPTGNPRVGAGLQQFRVWVRKTGSGGNTTTGEIRLQENGTDKGQLWTGTITNTTGELVTGNWNASSLGTANGSLVQCVFNQLSGGTGVLNRRGIEVGAVEWVVDYVAAGNRRRRVIIGS